MKIELSTRWMLMEAQEVVRKVQQPSRDYGYHVVLGGGVLNNGTSDKDLDLFFLPLFGRHVIDPAGLEENLISTLGNVTQLYDASYRPDEDNDSAVLNMPHRALKVETSDGRRIDVFIVATHS